MSTGPHSLVPDEAPNPSRKRHGRGWRWVKRGALGTLGFLVLAIGGAVGIIHTDWGRAKLRAIVEAQLANTFTGGATLGKLEGSPFTVLTLRDLVINGPDQKPAIAIKRLDVDVGLLPLISHQARVLAVKADGVDVDLRRGTDGSLQIADLMKPDPNADPNKKSSWSVALPRVELRHAHVQFDRGTEKMNFDDLSIDARAKIPAGGPIDASLELATNWRERKAAHLTVDTVLHKDDRGIRVPTLQVHAGDVAVVGNQLDVVMHLGKLPTFSGALMIKAGAEAVAQLVPEVALPDDVDVSLTARPVAGQPWTEIALAGTLGQTPIQLLAQADLAGKHAKGELTTGTLDLTKLSGAKIEGTAAASAVFDVRPGGTAAMPVANATIRGWGAVAGVPKTDFALTLGSAGERAQAKLDATGEGVKVALDAAIHRVDNVLTIEAAKLAAEIADPARASGGKAPVHGSLKIDLAAHGAVQPEPSIALTGTIDGKRLRMQDLHVGSLHIAVDAARLPARPLGKAHIEARDIVRQTLQLAQLTVDAGDRADGKVAVSVRSRPKQNPWLVDLDAIITPPAKAAPSTLAVDITKHRIRVANGQDWTGRSGHVEVAPDKIVIRDFASHSVLGKLAIDGFYDRAGRHAGDFRAKVDAKALSLESFGHQFHGMLDAHIEAGKHKNVWDGEVVLAGRNVSLDPNQLLIDSDLHVALHGTKLTVDADAKSTGLGTVKLAVDMDTPANVADARAWKKLGRDGLRTSQLTLQGIEIRRIAELAGLDGDYHGRIDGDFQVTADTIGGRLEVHDVVAPQMRGITGVNAQLDLTQTAPTELAPSLAINVDGIGRLEGNAKIQMPDQLFDAGAWKALGKRALRGASVRVENVAVDPALLDRLGIASDMRAQLDVAVDVGEAANKIDAKVDVAQLRGAPIVQPLNIHLGAQVSDKETKTKLEIKTAGPAANPDGGAQLFVIDGRLPGSLDEILARVKRWQADPKNGGDLPLDVTAALPKVDATRLMAVIGRTEIIGGQLDGTIKLGGTIGKPDLKVDLAALNIKVPPGRGGKPIRTVEKLAITGGWSGGPIKLAVNATESSGGSLKMALDADPSAMRDAKVTLQATKLDLLPILAFLPGPAGGASGELNANLHVTGLDARTMQLGGELHLIDARLPIAASVGTLRRAKIDAVIADRQVTIGVDGKLGGGTVKMTGSIALDGASPSAGKAKITLRKIAPIGTVEPQISADVNATLKRDKNQWHAQLVVDHGNVIIGKEKGEKIKPAGPPDDMKFINGDTQKAAGDKDKKMAEKVPENPVFLVDITLHPTRVESEEFRGNVRGKLQIKANGDELGILGSINAESGDLDLFGRRYYLDRAAVSFDGPIDPLLDVRITHEFPDFTTITSVRGRVSKPELTLASDPGTYSQGELLGFLLGGDPAGDPQYGSASDKVAASGTSFLANKVSGYVKQALPVSIDVLRYEAATADSSAAVTVGTWISHSLFLSYRQHLESRPDENTGEGSLEYWFTRRIMLQGTAGDRNYDGIDLLWRKRY
ncbi:MAG TPA: translocation/assembly module TamB domain-containing protein [Kofleriaceae bacterium]|nr:translocation/assembly module TamB domain-containing protein [Kofleriaceae bacterium]